MDLSIAAMWGVISGLVGAGIAWGALMQRSKANSQRIEELKMSTDESIVVLRTQMTALALAQTEHRTETTDRLARIETKLDQALDQ